MVAGGIGEFATYWAMTIFAIYLAFLSKDLMGSKYVVSVGDKGVFDRRVSTDWIPCSAIGAVTIVNRASQSGLLFKFSQSDDIRKKMRRTLINHATASQAGAPHEFLVEASKLKGGFTALHNAVTSFYQIPQDGRVH